jgi:parvulin-like peptidyl-prolyl isomerase
MRYQTWAVALAGAAALAILANQGLAQPAAARPAAVVNGEAITLAQIDAMLNRDGPKAVQVPESKLREMRRAALAMMIDSILFQQYIRKTCPPAAPQEVEKEFENLKEGLKKVNKTLEEYCKENGSTLSEVRDDIADMVRWRTMVHGKTGDAELQRYYTENKDFFDQVAVRASHIVLRVAPDAAESEKQAAIAKLKALRAEIIAGKIDFAEAAKKHSQCPTAPNGGDLNFFPRKFVVDEAFAKAAFAMKVGDVSDVVQTDFGYHLIKVTDRKAGTPSDFAKMKEDVRMIYAGELQTAIVQQQRKVSKVEINLP